VYRRNTKIEEAPLQGELMLFDPEQARFFVLNRTMTALWRRCDGQTTFEGMLDCLRTSFQDAEPAPLEEEVRAALGQLVELGLVIPVNSEAPRRHEGDIHAGTDHREAGYQG
jgi:hypothetical protein